MLPIYKLIKKLKVATLGGSLENGEEHNDETTFENSRAELEEKEEDEKDSVIIPQVNVGLN